MPSQDIFKLIEEFGPEEIHQAAEKLLENYQPVPAAFMPVLEADQLISTCDRLDASVTDVITAAEKKRKAYGQKFDYIKRKEMLETEIELQESEAIMSIEGEGKNQFAMIGDKKVFLTNDKLRDAYRRNTSAEKRKELAEVRAELAVIDSKYAQANDEWQGAVEATHSVQYKAELQAGLLKFLCRRTEG